MITSLSSILRYSISTKSFIVTIADEYEWLEKIFISSSVRHK